MTLRNRFLGFLALLVFAIGAQASAAAITKCPSGGTPSPGSVVTGGLEVDDVCVLTDVTIYGGVVVDAVPPQPAPPQTAPFPLLELRSGQVYGERASVLLDWLMSSDCDGTR